ncbi:hypothetical protein ACG0Z6_06960 [Roseateles sp. BYS180W]|uniref:Uncharacterized protein n=1 Tax=Roseateles rivi TaxID=3299028 RepID=A0ABW7FUI6_9BURK
MLKSQSRTDTAPRRMPMPEWIADKGRKHEAFEGLSLGSERRSHAQVIQFDRKR